MKNGDFFPTRKKQDFSQFRIIAVKKRRRVLNHFFTLKCLFSPRADVR